MSQVDPATTAATAVAPVSGTTLSPQTSQHTQPPPKTRLGLVPGENIKEKQVQPLYKQSGLDLVAKTADKILYKLMQAYIYKGIHPIFCNRNLNK